MKRFTTIVLACFIASSYSYAVNLGKLVDEALGFMDTAVKAGARTKDELKKLQDQYYLPEPLKGSEYKRVFKQYNEEIDDDDWENHKFEKVANIQLKYCKMGLTNACGDLGGAFMLSGVGATRDANRAIRYIEYAVKNSPYEGFQNCYLYALKIAKELKNYDDASTIRYVQNLFKQKRSECESDKASTDSCFEAIVILNILPSDMFGLTKEQFENVFVALGEKDILTNGTKHSKLFKMAEAYEELKK